MYKLCDSWITRQKIATAELRLSFLAYNMIIAINMVGIKRLLKAMIG